jgi:hypothetical protein
MLKKIFSISGKPGLYKLMSQTKTMFIVESLTNHKRLPVYMRDRITTLSDITIFTDTDNLPLQKAFRLIWEKQNGAPLDLDRLAATPEMLKTWFAEIIPDFDKERVYPSDIKKIITWYNLLIHDGLTRFEEEDPAQEEPSPQEKAQPEATTAPETEDTSKTTEQ